MIDVDEAARQYVDELPIGPEADLEGRLAGRRRRRRALSGAAGVALFAGVALVANGVVSDDGRTGDLIAVGNDEIPLDDLYADAPRAEPEEILVPTPVESSLPDGWTIELDDVTLLPFGESGAHLVFRLDHPEGESTLMIGPEHQPDAEGDEVFDIPGAEHDATFERTDELLSVTWQLEDGWSARLLPSDLDEGTLLELASTLEFEPGPFVGAGPREDGPAAYYPGYDDRVLASGVVDGQPWRLLANDAELALTPEFEDVVAGGTSEYDETTLPSVTGGVEMKLLSYDGSRLVIVITGETPDSIAVVHPDGTRTEQTTFTIADGALVVAAMPIPADVAASSIEVVGRSGGRVSLHLPAVPQTGSASLNLGTRLEEDPTG
ncbi:MAG: hypothetical protein S0880_17615 [Actinomycetota bacterium]|nr:hypothetical protein [Actinomycetota bacterium]